MSEPERFGVQIDGLPANLPAGDYRIFFGGYVEHPKGGPPVLHFRYSGPADAELTEAEQMAMTAEETATQQPPKWTRYSFSVPDPPQRIVHSHSHLHPADPVEHTDVTTHTHTHGHPAGGTGSHEHAHGPGELRPAPFSLPVPEVTTIDVARLARVIAELLRMGVIHHAAIGLPLDPDSTEGWGSVVERWLRGSYPS